MKSFFLVALMALVGFVTYAQDYPADYAQAPRFKVLFYHSEEVEEAHRQFAQQTRNLPEHYVMPSSEWYQWNPSPRENPDVEVLLSISPKNYPLGIKDIVRWGDFPVVWTNKKYRMIYLNCGHGDEMFSDATQNLLYVNAFRWIALGNK